jgi:uncharacterized membrane protein YfcA
MRSPMPSARPILLALFALVGAGFAAAWARAIRRDLQAESHPAPWRPGAFHLAVGFVTDFLDTLGIGSFATTTAAYRLAGRVDDRLVPGTLNVGHALPTIVQALVYVTIIDVDMTTLVVMIGAAVAGAWLGSGVVAGWPRRTVRAVMGAALLGAAGLMLASALGALPRGGAALALPGVRLAAGAAGNFALGALMAAGIGLYAPCMILVSVLGMSPAAAFPIMMGSCALLMPVGSVRFVQRRAYDVRAALGLTLAGTPAVLIAAFVVRSLALGAIRWLVIGVALYTATTLLLAARREDG